MIGGSPIPFQPGMPHYQPMPVPYQQGMQPYPQQPQQARGPGQWQPAPAGNPLQPMQPRFGTPPQNGGPVLGSLAAGAPTPAQPIFRGAAPEAPVQAVSLPSPQQLGVGLASPQQLGIARPPPAAPVADVVDWNETHARLRRIGAVGVRFDRKPQGGYRMMCELPTRQPGQTQMIEGHGETEAIAVASALQQAETWAVSGR